MERTYNALEIFTIAEQIERNGAAFYQRAAELFEDPGAAEIFTRLAEEEVMHEAVLVGMRTQMTADAEVATFDLEDAPLDVEALAGLAAFDPDATAQLTGSESRADVLRFSLQKEEESVVYYTLLRKFIADDLAGEKVAAILAEEQGHVELIRQALAACE